MSRVRHCLGLAAHSQLLPALEGGEEVLVGGQAVIEGVMMRSPHAYCVAVRQASGAIVTRTGPLERLSERRRIWKYPVLRGLGMLGQALALGIRALRYSANVVLEQENAKQGSAGKAEISTWVMAVNLAFSVGFFLFLYKFLPLLLATQLQNHFPAVANHFAFNAVDGVLRLLLFLAFLLAISCWREIGRVYQYHGAEHKVVFNFESKQPLSVENARAFPTFHPRCGTSFLLVVLLISMAIYTLVPVESFAMRLLARVALLPVIAGVSFEVIRVAARRQGMLWVSMVAPGLWLQRITTRPPSDDQLEVSISALNEAMALEAQRGGELVIA